MEKKVTFKDAKIELDNSILLGEKCKNTGKTLFTGLKFNLGMHLFKLFNEFKSY